MAPSHAARTGLREPRATAATARAASVGGSTGRGTCSAITPSVLASEMTVPTAAANRSGGASPRTSTGLPRSLSSGSSASSAASVCGSNSASGMPASRALSAASSAGPRPFATTAIRSPCGMRPDASRRAAAKSCV